MNLWPISKLKETFRSIDTQLRQQEERLTAQGKDIVTQEKDISAQNTHIAVLEELVARLQESEKVSCERIHHLEQDLMRLKKQEEDSQQEIANRLYLADLQCVNLQFQLCDIHLPQNSIRYEALENRHKGEKCFIIGNGPSLKIQDLETLHKKKITTFGSNKIYRAFGETSWRPDYYMCQDRRMLEHNWAEIGSLEGMTFFYPHQAISEKHLDIRQKNAILFPFKTINIYPVWFTYNPLMVLHEGKTVTFSLLQLAEFMGFSEVYLLGVDCDYPTIQDASGELVVDKKAQTHFIKDYWSENELIYQPDTKTSMQAYKSAQEYSETHEIKFYNATRGGALEAFPRIDFEEAIKRF